eukprot:5487481-Ditylum_brightwellii.AAC.1
MADGGANGRIINNLSLFTTYTFNLCLVAQGSGDSADCLGWSLAFMEIPHSTYPIILLWPCYYMLKNPQSTLNHQALKGYTHFCAVNTDTLE